MTAPVSGSGAWPTWMARVSKSMRPSLTVHALEPELPRQARDRPLARLGAAEAGLGMPGPQRQRARLAIGAQVCPADDAIARDQRQHVVAVAALRLRLVHLDQVGEAE